MNSFPALDRLAHTALTPDQQERLNDAVGAVLAHAIAAREPQRRPPGKAGLRAEKGYYRLLYLESDLQSKFARDEREAGSTDDGRHLTGLLRQLADIPDLQAEIRAGIEAAIDAILP